MFLQRNGYDYNWDSLHTSRRRVREWPYFCRCTAHCHAQPLPSAHQTSNVQVHAPGQRRAADAVGCGARRVRQCDSSTRLSRTCCSSPRSLLLRCVTDSLNPGERHGCIEDSAASAMSCQPEYATCACARMRTVTFETQHSNTVRSLGIP
jgi:hypothetical protein